MKPATIKRHRLEAMFGAPLPAHLEAMVDRPTGTAYEESDEMMEVVVFVEASDRDTGNERTSSIPHGWNGKPMGNSFGNVNVVPADRPGIMVGGRVLRPGPATGYWMRKRTTKDERAAIAEALKDVPHTVAFTSSIYEHQDVCLAKHGVADQGIRRADLPKLPVEVIEALIAKQDAKAIDQGVLEWFKVDDHPKAARIAAACDAQKAKLSKDKIAGPGKTALKEKP